MEIEAIYSRQSLEMITVANEFCIYINEIDKYEQSDIFKYLHHICPLLYLKGSLLPTIQIEDEQANERFMTQEEWAAIFHKLRIKFGANDEFLFIAPNEKMDFNPVKNSLADQLADVYQDLKDFLLLYQKSSKAAKQNAVAECKSLFESHWGYRVVSIQQALHYKLYSQPDFILGNNTFDL